MRTVPMRGSGEAQRSSAPARGEVVDIALVWAKALAERTVLPVVRRETLVWSGGRGGEPVVVAFDAENPSDRPSRPVTAGLGVAGFGAFLPSRVVASVPIPILLPGARLRVEQSLGSVDLPAPPQGLAALLPDERVERRWAGNMDLWMEGRLRVERHCAHLRCLSPGVESVALALVHAAQDEALSFASTAPGPEWAVQLHYGVRGPVAEGAWIPARSGATTLLVGIRPPLDADGSGGVTVHVTRRSDGRSVPIEFALGC